MTKPRPKNRYAGVYRTGTGHYRYVIDLPTTDGTRRQKSVSRDTSGQPFRTAESARDARNDHLRRLRQPDAPAATTGTLAAFLAQWLARLELRDSSRITYQRFISQYIVPHLGDVPLAELHQRHILDWLSTLAKQTTIRRKPLSPTTINKAHSILGSAMTAAVALDLVPRNVVVLVKAPSVAPGSPTTWTREQAGHFLNSTATTPYGSLWRVMLMTGLRIGEVLALGWEDVDLDRGRLHVRRTLTIGADGRARVGDQPKTRSSDRDIAIPPEVVAALRRRRDEQVWQRRQAGAYWQDTGLVWTRWQGSHLAESTVQQRLARDCKAAGLDPVTPHSLRHIAATLMVEAGVPLEVVSQRLGHANATITSALYVGRVVRQDEAAAEALERYVSGS